MYHVRNATAADVKKMALIEQACFPKAEAATLQKFTDRFAVFAGCFYVAEVDGEVVGHINGCINDKPELPDELYEDAALHKPGGSFQAVFGLAVDPAFQRKGLASLLVRHFIKASQAKDHQGMVLTCKDHLLGFYENLGFTNQGASASNHGGAQWYDMLMVY